MFSPNACWPENSIVCGSWTCGVDGEVHNIYGNEHEMSELVDAIEAADFVVAQNGKFDLKWLKRAGIDLYKIVLYDTLIAEYCINGNQTKPLDLDTLAKKYLGAGKEHFINILMKKHVCPSEMPKSMLVSRCNDDIKQTRDIFLLQRKIIKDTGLLGCVYTRCVFTPPLTDIESYGVCLDAEAVRKQHTASAIELAKISAEIDEFTEGRNPASYPQMKEFIYDVLKFKPLYKGMGKNKEPTYGTDNDTILTLKATTKKQREFQALKLEWSKWNAQVTKTLDYFKGVVDEKNPEGDIVYANFNQTTTKTHRLSCSGVQRKFKNILGKNGKPKPKGIQLQNIDGNFKCLLKARNDGWPIGEGDGSQLEFRVAGFMGQCTIATQEIVDGVDVHTQSAAVINGVPKEEVTSSMRGAAKADTFKPLYGGKQGTEGQKAYYKWFGEHYKGLTDKQDRWLSEAMRTKKVVLPHGFIFYWPYARPQGKNSVEGGTKIVNAPVQHFATGEIIPIAVTYLWHLMREMESFLVNTVHDSAIAELHPDEKAEFTELCKYAFTHCVYHYLKEVYNIEFNVPLGVGVKIGRNWGTGDEVACTPIPPYRMDGVDYSNLNTDWESK